MGKRLGRGNKITKWLSVLAYVLCITLVLVGCGSGSIVAVNWHHVSLDELQATCGEPCHGCATWGSTPEGREYCDIYLMNPWEYEGRYEYIERFKDLTPFDYYLLVRGHEDLHCEQGDFHE